jgi:8-oxo-dGTP diphosphatase
VSFCSRCGVGKTGSTCGGCGYQTFLNPRPTASLVILDEHDRILLLKRARPPQQGMWELPGGFCDGWEEPVDAALREGREELGVDVVLGPFVGMYIGGYAFQGEVLPVLDCYWLATLEDPGAIVVDPEETLEWAWFPLRDPPPLAFSTMIRAVGNVALARGQIAA